MDERTEKRCYLPVCPPFTTADDFIRAKVKILREHFKIGVTEDEIAYLRTFKTESEINAAVKSIINKHWE